MQQDYFSLLGVTRSYRPDLELVNQNYLKLQRKFHPDNFVTGTQQEKLLAVQMTSYLNDALRVLEDDVARAEYLLKLSGIETIDDAKTMQDVEFLEQQIRLREELAELEGDSVANFIAKVQNNIDRLGDEFVKNLDNNFEQAGNLVEQLKFFKKLKLEAKQKT